MVIINMTLHLQSQELTKLLYSLSDLLQVQEQEQLCCYDLTSSECRTLSYLKRYPEHPITMNVLAKRLYLTRSGATRVVDKLSEKEYVIRKIHPGDRRACCIESTPQGSQLIDQIETEIDEYHQQILERLDPSMRHVVLAALQSLQSATDQVRHKKGSNKYK